MEVDQCLSLSNHNTQHGSYNTHTEHAHTYNCNYIIYAYSWLQHTGKYTTVCNHDFATKTDICLRTATNNYLCPLPPPFPSFLPSSLLLCSPPPTISLASPLLPSSLPVCSITLDVLITQKVSTEPHIYFILGMCTGVAGNPYTKPDAETGLVTRARPSLRRTLSVRGQLFTPKKENRVHLY